MYGEGPSQPGTVTIARPRQMSITFGGDMPSSSSATARPSGCTPRSTIR
jgi:hypothetical protein